MIKFAVSVLCAAAVAGMLAPAAAGNAHKQRYSRE